MRLSRLWHCRSSVPSLAAACLFAGLLAGCSPTLNWREVRLAPTRLQALMPCKPEEAAREVPLDGRTVTLHLAGCDADGATFVIGWTAVDPPGQLGSTLGAWQDAALQQAGLTAGPDAPAGRPFVPPGGTAVAQSVRIAATGRRPDGAALPLQAAWFAATGGSTPHALHAAVYGTPKTAEAAETFFAGLRLP